MILLENTGHRGGGGTSFQDPVGPGVSWNLCVGKMPMAEGPALSQMSWDLLGLAWELSSVHITGLLLPKLRSSFLLLKPLVSEHQGTTLGFSQWPLRHHLGVPSSRGHGDPELGLRRPAAARWKQAAPSSSLPWSRPRCNQQTHHRSLEILLPGPKHPRLENWTGLDASKR